jgi:hypothetical protein
VNEAARSVVEPAPGASKLIQTARVTRLLATGGFAAFALFLLTEVGLDSIRPSGAPARPPPPRALASEPEQQAPRPVEPPQVSSAVRIEQTAGPLSPHQILIDLGPPRSEVFVDGHSVGRSPFMGQVKCRPGREISIVVVPERGLPIEEKRVCPP